MRKTYEFVSTDMDELDRLLVAGYEQFFGKTVMPGSPERLFISWVEDAIMYERAQNNWTGCQNLPSSAEGEYLDGLAELFYLQERPKPTAATCTMRFYISEPRQTAVLAFQFGDGLSDIMWPTGMAPIMCGLAGVKLEKWWKWLFPLIGLLVLTQAILVVISMVVWA